MIMFTNAKKNKTKRAASQTWRARVAAASGPAAWVRRTATNESLAPATVRAKTRPPQPLHIKRIPRPRGGIAGIGQKQLEVRQQYEVQQPPLKWEQTTIVQKKEKVN